MITYTQHGRKVPVNLVEVDSLLGNVLMTPKEEDSFPCGSSCLTRSITLVASQNDAEEFYNTLADVPRAKFEEGER